MALFAHTTPHPVSVLNGGMEKLALRDPEADLTHSLKVSPVKTKNAVPNGKAHGDHDSSPVNKEPMHSILKTHSAGGDDKPARSAPVDVPMKKSASMPAASGTPASAAADSTVMGSFSSSPSHGSYQDMYKLWGDDQEDSCEFHKIVPPARRSLSLKAHKAPPDSAGPKKMVRFADAMGLDLEKVRHFFQDQLPNTGVEDTPISSLPDEKYRHFTAKYLTPAFPQPCLSSSYLDRVRNQKVCVDSVQATDFLVTGLVRVLNIAFEKSVMVRYTFDNWKTSFDTIAQYVPNSNDNFSDRFQFLLCAPPSFDIGQTLQFAVCFRAGGIEYWDSNYGQNYSMICCAGQAFTGIAQSPSSNTNAFL
ncbi:glycogen-binding subunit 76A-like [Paramacrobiotus metropolitanus]|uniref:glycogen-binding subunit 76A-like n=1 Tax=Paramacrobiotus metropolitanus TaxID=2943436 RepID=UPI002445984E|nr:glycogen-binding subunit 76A-like [Paramacrobiotus metropolitanus]